MSISESGEKESSMIEAKQLMTGYGGTPPATRVSMH